MQLGLVGLGRMGGSMARRLMAGGHQIVAWDQRADAVIDGGDTHFKDDVRRARELTAKGLRYVDVGTSGGIWGAERGRSALPPPPQAKGSCTVVLPVPVISSR